MKHRANTDADPEWEFVGVSYGLHPFQIGGLDVWQHEWTSMKERVNVKDPQHQQDFTFDVYETGSANTVVRFAAGEFSNGVWGFYVRKQAN